MIVINKIVLIGFVQSPLDASAQFGQDHDIQILVFQNHGMVLHILRHIADFLTDGQRIYLAGRALIGPLLNKQRILFRLAGAVCGDRYDLLIS